MERQPGEPEQQGRSERLARFPVPDRHRAVSLELYRQLAFAETILDPALRLQQPLAMGHVTSGDEGAEHRRLRVQPVVRAGDREDDAGALRVGSAPDWFRRVYGLLPGASGPARERFSESRRGMIG